jgi:ABC-type phosphate transport system substrate-binding protein
VIGLQQLSRALARHAPRRRAFAFVFVVALAVVASGCIASPGVADLGPRTLTVSPATGLRNQVVQVRWTGFTPTVEDAFTVTLYQCKGSPHSLNDCYQLIRPPAGGDPLGTGVDHGVTDAGGKGSIFLEVRPAFDLPVLNCTAAHACSIVAFENDGSAFPEDALPQTAVTAPLTFAPSPSDCPKVSTFDVVTGGEASASEALYSWSADTCTASKPLSIDYTESSSPSGRRDFIAGNVDVGITSMPADPATEPSERTYTYAPVDVSGVVIAFNVTDTQTGQRITDMTLTPRLVAMLLAGTQSGGPGTHLFQDPEFLELNPGHSWPENTQPPLLRAEKNADAYLLTRWLQEDPDARRYLDGNDPSREVDAFWKGVSYPSDIFQAFDPNTIGNYNPRQGTVTNVRRLFNFQAPGDGASVSPQIDGILGVFDVVSALKFGLPVAKLVPAHATGAAGVAPNADGLAAGYQAMVADTGAPTKHANVGATGGAYPLVKVDYAMVPTSGISAEKANNIAAFLQFAAGDGQTASNLPAGYLPMPSDLQALANTAREAVLAAPTAPTAPTDTPPADVSSDSSVSTDFSSSLGDLGLGGSDFSSDLGVDGAGGSSGTGGSGGTSPSEHSGAKPLSVRFLGSQGHFLLPILLVLGLAALIAGPTMMVLLRRRPNGDPVAVGADGEGPHA